MMTAVAVPPALAEALGHMQRPVACPEDVRARIVALRVPAEEVSGTRGLPMNWRQGPSAAGGGGGGWQQRRERHHEGGGRHHDGGGHRHHEGGGGGGRPPPRFPTRAPYPDRAAMPRFGNKANTAATTEDRMMDKIRGKMNKFSELTYDTTKGWLSELLDSGETGFLSGFIHLVFAMAAAASSDICPLYARLLVELMTAFPHLKVEMCRIYTEFLHIFDEAAEEPTVGSVEYTAYVALRDRRRYRRGYATFIGEIAKDGVLPASDVLITCNKILEGIRAARTLADKSGLCEEYADCLKSLMTACEDLLRPHVGDLIPQIKAAMDRTGAPSMTNKARFALMDITDLFE